MRQLQVSVLIFAIFLVQGMILTTWIVLGMQNHFGRAALFAVIDSAHLLCQWLCRRGLSDPVLHIIELYTATTLCLLTSVVLIIKRDRQTNIILFHDEPCFNLNRCTNYGTSVNFSYKPIQVYSDIPINVSRLEISHLRRQSLCTPKSELTNAMSTGLFLKGQTDFKAVFPKDALVFKHQAVFLPKSTLT